MLKTRYPERTDGGRGTFCCSVAFALLVAVFTVWPSLQAQLPLLHEPRSEVAGKSIAEWSREWWQWGMAIPADGQHPTEIDSEEACHRDQAEREVFFLVGGTLGQSERSCTVPADKPVLISPLNLLAWFPGDCAADDLDSCMVLLSHFMDGTCELHLSVEEETEGGDAPALVLAPSELRKYREEYGPFDFLPATPPPFFGLPPLPDNEPYLGFSDGYFLMLKFEPGEYTLRYGGYLCSLDFGVDITYHLTVVEGSGSPAFVEGPESPPFRRGDVNDDGRVNLSDAVVILQNLFGGAVTLSCDDAADTDDDGDILLTDAIRLLGYLFQNGEAPPPPGVACGEDPTADELRECSASCSPAP